MGQNGSVVERGGSQHLSGPRGDTEAIDSSAYSVTCRKMKAQLEWTTIASTEVRKGTS